jgi:ribosomal protein S18 acetylase RimI-like enzyme
VGGVRHPLDDPVFTSLTGPQAGLAVRNGNAMRYPSDVAPFFSLPADPDDGDWASAASMAAPGETVMFPALHATPPPGSWELLSVGEGVQLVAGTIGARPDPEAVPLGPADVPDMLDLAARTRPGPFLPRTIELGGYLGIRGDGKLVAMAGERMRPPGHGEISAVCTDEAWRGHGLARRLTLAVAAAIEARGDVPFLHAYAGNAAAIGLYRLLGFRHRRDVLFPVARVTAPGSAGQPG